MLATADYRAQNLQAFSALLPRQCPDAGSDTDRALAVLSRAGAPLSWMSEQARLSPASE